MPFSTGNTLRYPLRTYQECDLGTALQQHAAVITSKCSRADNQKAHDNLLCIAPNGRVHTAFSAASVPSSSAPISRE